MLSFFVRTLRVIFISQHLATANAVTMLLAGSYFANTTSPYEATWHDGLEDYKFGDAIEGWNERKNTGYAHFIDYCCHRFPGSIVCDYRRLTTSFVNIGVLTEISKRRAFLYHNAKSGCLSLPNPDALVIHLRLGDVMQAENCFYNSKRCGSKILSSKCWSGVLTTHTAMFKRPIVIMSNHRRVRDNSAGISHSLQYMKDVVAWVKTHFNNTNIRFRDDCQPDHDFVFATHARQLLPAHGGFSTLIAKTAQNLGSNVLQCDSHST